jgi:hypothetical protein
MDKQQHVERVSAPKRRGRGCLVWLGGIAAALLGLMLLGALYESVSEARDRRAYPPPGQLRDVTTAMERRRAVVSRDPVGGGDSPHAQREWRRVGHCHLPRAEALGNTRTPRTTPHVPSVDDHVGGLG